MDPSLKGKPMLVSRVFENKTECILFVNYYFQFGRIFNFQAPLIPKCSINSNGSLHKLYVERKEQSFEEGESHELGFIGDICLRFKQRFGEHNQEYHYQGGGGVGGGDCKLVGSNVFCFLNFVMQLKWRSSIKQCSSIWQLKI